ncbi:MAG TPA: enoyl-CoA hydratase [bacterium]|nr:enoyl-CoA hydratase [bacterium]HEV2440313.1 enoyl-CoA hydratase [bacterium]
MDELLVRRDGPVATVTLNRPEKHNAVTVAMWEALPGVLAPLAADPGVRAVVVRGAGDEAFASGADISEFEHVRSGAASARAYSALVATAERALADLPKPTIAMIHGFCVGGGLEIALACDLRWAGQTGRFGITAARLGIVYGLGATRRLAAAVGPSRARDLLFSGRLLEADEALAMGLVNRVYAPEELDRETYAYARGLAQQAPLSQQGAKAMLQHLAGEGTMTDRDIAAFVEAAYESIDYREGVRAFLARRPARFEGR